MYQEYRLGLLFDADIEQKCQQSLRTQQTKRSEIDLNTHITDKSVMNDRDVMSAEIKSDRGLWMTWKKFKFREQWLMFNQSEGIWKFYSRNNEEILTINLVILLDGLVISVYWLFERTDRANNPFE